MRRGQRLVGALWRWHRRIGLVAALFVLLLAITGIALNHSGGLGLDSNYVSSPWLLRAYGEAPATPSAFPVDDNWISRAASGSLYMDAREMGTCRGDLIGALAQGELLVVACAEELILLLRDGQLVEALSSSNGLPVPLTGLGMINEALAIQYGEAWWMADVDAVSFEQRAPSGSIITQMAPGALPATIADALPNAPKWLTWERLLQDLHSGRVFGYAGVLIMDAAAVLLMCLASSGFAMWWLHRRRRGDRA